MTPTETTTILRQLNEWRRGDEDIPQPDPRVIGEAIDAAVEMIDRLEAAEKERDALRAAVRHEADCVDAAKAEIEAMEQQEPVYLFRRKGLDDFCTCSKEKYEVFSANPQLFEVKTLYALPGAQPQLNEIKITLKRALELSQRETWTGVRKHRSWEDQREEQQCWNKVWSLLDA